MRTLVREHQAAGQRWAVQRKLWHTDELRGWWGGGSRTPSSTPTGAGAAQELPTAAPADAQGRPPETVGAVALPVLYLVLGLWCRSPRERRTVVGVRPPADHGQTRHGPGTAGVDEPPAETPLIG